MRFTKKATRKATTTTWTLDRVEVGLEWLQALGVPVPVDPTPEWVRAALLRLARDLRAQANAVAKLARAMTPADDVTEAAP